jgi:hypothetical protein
MSQFFTGFDTSGAWSCFDEFNRIGIKALSMIALDSRRLKISAHALFVLL